MTIFRLNKEAFVWIWLPGKTKPVVAGKLTAEGNDILFNYGQSYLEREDAIAIYDKELPLRQGVLALPAGLTMPGSIRDASPDAWGRRVIINKLAGLKRETINNIDLDEITYLLQSGSDRIGALDFQLSAINYTPRVQESIQEKNSLEQLLSSAEKVEKGIPLSEELDQALHHGSSIGGARPKAMLESGDKKYIAKFSTSADIYSVVKAEFMAMRLAKLVGLDVANVSLVKVSGKDVLLIERFDRVKSVNGWARKIIISALTMLELDEMMARYASYEKLAEIIRHRFTEPKATLRELFSRLVFNILCGNTDDHARNHAAFWNGETLSLTPAYDICPQSRVGGEATQAMLISGTDRMSRLTSVLDAAGNFLISNEDARGIINSQIDIIQQKWGDICAEADLSEIERNLFWRRQFLNPYAFDGYD